jgi:hypothetical protein
MRRKRMMENKIAIDKWKLECLVGYVHDLLDFIDVDDFEDEENVELVNGGYESFVKPILEMLEEDTK